MSNEAPSLIGIHVLVAEDEYILASQIARDLSAIGVIPLGPVPDVAGALKLIANAPRVDAAILDVRLRGKMSFPVADELLQRGIPFVFVTCNADAVRHYDVPIFSKPAEMAVVAESLASLVDAKTRDEVARVLSERS